MQQMVPWCLSATENLISSLAGLSGLPQAKILRVALVCAVDICMSSSGQMAWCLISRGSFRLSRNVQPPWGPSFPSDHCTSAGILVSTHKWKLFVIPVFAASVLTFGWNPELLHSDQQVSWAPCGQNNTGGADTLSVPLRHLCCLIVCEKPAEPQRTDSCGGGCKIPG